MSIFNATFEVQIVTLRKKKKEKKKKELITLSAVNSITCCRGVTALSDLLPLHQSESGCRRRAKWKIMEYSRAAAEY